MEYPLVKIDESRMLQVRRILVCQLRQIGDVLLSTPSVELLARRFPSADIHFFTEKKCVSMLSTNPHISKVWAVDKQAFGSFFQELQFYRQVTATPFDLVVDFQQLPRCRWVVALSRAPLRVSYPPRWYNRVLYTHWYQSPPCYAAAYKASILAPLGISWSNERPQLYLTHTEEDEANQLLMSMGIETSDTHQLLVTLDITHRHSTRQWPAAHYGKLMELLADVYPYIRFLLFYGPGEKEEVTALWEKSRVRSNIIVPEQMLTLREMAACMRFAHVHIGNCSAPRHIAVACNLPTITFLGATSQGWTFPSEEHIDLTSGMPCQPCNKNACPYGTPQCLETLLPETVLSQVITHIERFGIMRAIERQ